MLKHKEQLLRLSKKIFFSSPFIWLSPSSVLAGGTNKPLRHWAGLKAIRLMEHLSANHNPIFLLMKHYPLLVNLQQWDEAFGSPNKSSTAPERKAKEWYSNKMLMLKIHINLSVWDGGGECHSLTLLTLAIIKLDFINSWGLLTLSTKKLYYYYTIILLIILYYFYFRFRCGSPVHSAYLCVFCVWVCVLALELKVSVKLELLPLPCTSQVTAYIHVCSDSYYILYVV